MDSGGWTHNDGMLKLIAKQRGSKIHDTLSKLIPDFPEDAKIEDYKEKLCKKDENGKFSDGLGILLYDLKIDEQNEKFIKETMNKLN